MGGRGHTLVWYRNVPEWFIIKEPDKEQALSIMSEYIADTMAHFKDAPIYAWDVVNEAFMTALLRSVWTAEISTATLRTTQVTLTGKRFSTGTEYAEKIT